MMDRMATAHSHFISLRDKSAAQPNGSSRFQALVPDVDTQRAAAGPAGGSRRVGGRGEGFRRCGTESKDADVVLGEVVRSSTPGAVGARSGRRGWESSDVPGRMRSGSAPWTAASLRHLDHHCLDL